MSDFYFRRIKNGRKLVTGAGQDQACLSNLERYDGLVTPCSHPAMKVKP